MNNPEVRRHYIGERFDVGHLLEKHRPVAIPQAAARTEVRELPALPGGLVDMSSQQLSTDLIMPASDLSVQFIQPQCSPEPPGDDEP